MYECGFMYIRFTAAILNFGLISTRYRRVLPLKKTSLSSPNTTLDLQRNLIQPYYVYQGYLLRATILLILDEFHQSKLLI